VQKQGDLCSSKVTAWGVGCAVFWEALAAVRSALLYGKQRRYDACFVVASWWSVMLCVCGRGGGGVERLAAEQQRSTWLQASLL